MRFAHMGDCHLGGWRQPELQELNFLCFAEALRRSLARKVDFILISGDLFDSAYPPIETLKRTFGEFRKVRDAGIPVFLIAGSHDYSVSGKTFLDVLERAGFCKNAARYTEQNSEILLEPIIHNNVAIYGFPGKKSGLEVDEIARIRLQAAPGFFSVLMLHTTIRDAIGDVPVKAVDEQMLPRVDYLALSHLHINYQKQGRVYSGPTFPNNFSELEELQGGSFYFFEGGRIIRESIHLKDVVVVRCEITNALTATEQLLERLSMQSVRDKIVMVRVSGMLEKGKVADIDFQKVERWSKEQGAFAFLKATSKLHLAVPEVKMEVLDSDHLESHIIHKFVEANQSKFNPLIPDLLRILSWEKNEDETALTFEDRLLAETERVVRL